jgi:hypothetical protein
MKTLSEVSGILRIPEPELLRCLLRLAGRSRMTISRLADLLTDAGAVANLKLDKCDIETLAMAAGRRINQNRTNSSTAEYL